MDRTGPSTTGRDPSRRDATGPSGPSGWKQPTVVVSALLVVAVVLVWSLVSMRTRPEAIGPRIANALLARFPGATVDTRDMGLVRASIPSGPDVNVHTASIFEHCISLRKGCGASIDAAVEDVDRVVIATGEPNVAMLQAQVVGDGGAGYRYGYVTEPLVGSLEVRYALVRGVASTFVTSAIADRLALTRPQLAAAAAARLAADDAHDGAVELVATVDGRTYRVRSSGDAAASLLDRDRMKRFAAMLRSPRLYAVVPSRGTLFVAAATPAGYAACATLVATPQGGVAGAGNVGVLQFDSEAPAGAALSLAKSPDGAS